MSSQFGYNIFNPNNFVSSTIGPTGPTGPQGTYPDLIIVGEKADLPTSTGGMIQLAANTTYLFTTTVDLTGDRLICGNDTAINGTSSENARIKSTGLTGAALITSQYSLPIRNIAIEALIGVSLNADSSKALDWHSVNFVNCPTVGSISNYSNFIMTDSSFLNSSQLTIGGTIGTVGFNGNLFSLSTGAGITISSTGTVSRRFRTIYSSFVVPTGSIGIAVPTGSSIPSEGYILDTVNFSGGGTYLSGITGGNDSGNKALFINCKGGDIDNTFVVGQLYMNNNATATVITGTSIFTPIQGTTTASSELSRFEASGTTLTCRASIRRKYIVQATLSFTAGSNNVCEFEIYESATSSLCSPSRTKSTANGAGRAENVSLFCVVDLIDGESVSLQGANNTAITNITVSDLNFMAVQV